MPFNQPSSASGPTWRKLGAAKVGDMLQKALPKIGDIFDLPSGMRARVDNLQSIDCVSIEYLDPRNGSRMPGRKLGAGATLTLDVLLKFCRQVS